MPDAQTLPRRMPNSCATFVRRMAIEDAMAIRRQASQRVQVGLEMHMTPEIAADLIEGGEAWTAVRASPDGRQGRTVACFGLRETFPGTQATAWAILSDDVGPSHLVMTRFAKRRILTSPLVRIEAVVRVSVAAECMWAKLVGMTPVALLRRFGALSEDHMLFERVRLDAPGHDGRAHG